MNSYAAAVGNMQVAAQDYERRCQEFERMSRNARIERERAEAAGSPTIDAPVRTAPVGLGGALARLVRRHALAH